jgi:uncharacterized NAD(P)/FAD-binding protein YdhS
MKTICIIGGGFSGLMTAVQLLSKGSELKIKIANEGHPPGCGIAYNTDRDEHLLNVPAGRMSAFSDQPKHFTDWLLAKEEYRKYQGNNLSNTFLPRKIYGEYITELIAPFLKDKRLELINCRAIGILKEKENYLVKFDNDSFIEANYVVLAMGNYLPAPPRISDVSILNHENYYADPWKNDLIKDIRPDENILIIGTGLTMIDWVSALTGTGFKGKIHSVSPRGYLPESHTEASAYPDFYREIKNKGLIEILRIVRFHIKKAERLSVPWQSVIDSLRPHAKDIWLGLSEKEKQQFISHLRHIWGVARHRLPADVHAAVRKLIQTGQVKVTGARLQSIYHDGNEFQITLSSRKIAEKIELKASRIINCTGPQINFNEINDPFVKSLISQNLVSAHPLKMGIRASEEGKVKDARENIVSRLYAVGSLLRGVLWESTAVPELRINAEIVAQQIIQDID